MLINKTLPELRELAKKRGIKYSGLNKDALLKALGAKTSKKKASKTSKKKASKTSKKKASKTSKKKASKNSVPENVINKELYRRVRTQVKSKVKVWPSAYASGLLVQAYKAAGGKYSGSKNKMSSLERWYLEKWTDICTNKPCGRSPKEKRSYPYCRPLKRITKDTPMTKSELIEKYGVGKIKINCSKKRNSPKILKRE